MQGRVEGRQAVGLVDDVIGPGFVVVCALGDPRQILDCDRLEFLKRIGTHVLTLDPAVPGALRDVDNALSGWLAEHGLQAVMSRPDFYAFGGVRTTAELPALVDDLRNQLTQRLPRLQGAAAVV